MNPTLHSNRDLHDLGHEGRNSVRDAGRTIATQAAHMGDVARTWWNDRARSARDTAGMVKDGAIAFGDRSQRYVRDEPTKSVLMAAAAGAVLTGLLLWLASSRRHTHY